MLGDIFGLEKIYIVCGYTDMRKSIDGLCAVIEDKIQSFMWLFRSGEDGLQATILYGYSPTGSGIHAREFLEGYHGYLETDGYQGYNHLPGIRRCSCWAHIGRYFIDAVPKGKQ